MKFLLKKENLAQYLLQKADEYNQPSFFIGDPISIPKQCQRQEDAEIMAFLMAILAWGRRELIVQAGQKLLSLFDHDPYHFVLHAKASDLKRCKSFVYRTFNGEDLLEIIFLLRELYYHDEYGLVRAFNPSLQPDGEKNAFDYIDHFLRKVDSLLLFSHTRKHFPIRNKTSPAKRLNLFLRWMVRKDAKGVDLGFWHAYISPESLVIPLDVHVMQTLQYLGLTTAMQPSRKLAYQITSFAKEICPADPCLLDYALFGLSYYEKLK